MAETKPSDINKVWGATGDNTAPDDSKISLGWVAELPPFQWMNYILNRNSSSIKYINERGIAEWDATTEYQISSQVLGSDDIHYKSIVEPNTNNDPTADDGSNWEVMLDNKSSGVDVGMPDADRTLTFGEYSSKYLNIVDGGVMLPGWGVIAPDEQREYVVTNSASYLIEFKTAAGTGVEINPGETFELYCDGTDVVSPPILGVSGLTTKGNVGVGNSSLEAWQAGASALQIGGNGALWADTAQGASKGVHLLQNAYFDATGWKYVSTDEASRYSQQNGVHSFLVAASGTAGSAITWTTALTLRNSGGVDIGANSGTDHHSARTAGSGRVILLENHSATTPGGIDIDFQNASPDNNTQTFMFFVDSTAVRARIYSDGDVWTSDAGTLTSDERLKTNIQDATPKLADLMQLKVRNFEWAEDYHPNKVGEKKLGFIAQEVEQVFPALISEHDIAPEKLDEDGNRINEPVMRKAIKNAFTPMLVKAIQEQQEIIEKLEARIEALEEK